MARQTEMALDLARQADAKTGQPQPWPARLPEQVRAVASVLAAQPGALSMSEIEAHFKGRGPWKRSLPRILDTLAALGRARHESAGWRA
jgi:hypothetical protein